MVWIGVVAIIIALIWLRTLVILISVGLDVLSLAKFLLCLTLMMLNWQGVLQQTFPHFNESSKPGYYSVILDNGIKSELIATLRCGIHRYTFPKSSYVKHSDIAKSGKIVFTMTSRSSKCGNSKASLPL